MSTRIDDAMTKLEHELLTSGRFDPANSDGVYLVAETIVGDVAASVEEIETALQRFEAAALVEGVSLPGVNGRAYKVLPTGHEAREKVLRSRQLRHPTLITQRAHSITDLIVALVNCPHIWNSRMTGAFLAAEPKMTRRELELYLFAFAPDEIRDACSALVEEGLLNPTMKYGSTEEAFELTGRGRQEYRSVSARLRIAAGTSILDVQTKSDIEIFNAWQSEHKQSRNAIRAALDHALRNINGLAGLVLPLRITEATEAGDGAIRIDVALQDRIAKADLFVGDLTPVYAYGDRLRVNENVLVEVGFALASKDPNQIILLAMKRNDVPGDASKAKPTFDIAHVRRHDFLAKDDLRRWLQGELEAVLRSRGWLREP